MNGSKGWRPDGVGPGLAGLEVPDRALVPSRIAAGAESLDLGPEALFLASEIARLADPGDPLEPRAALLLALAILAAEREGSTRIPTSRDQLRPLLEELGGSPDEIDRALERAASPPDDLPWLGRVGAYRPLVSDGRYLSTQRLDALESRLGEALRRRLEAPSPESGPTETTPILRALRESPPVLGGGVRVLLSAEQERAVNAVLDRPLTLVTGGPGTGKTSVVVSILRAFARRRPWSPDRVALAAPTGRAADRLRSSFVRFLDSIEETPAADRSLLEAPPEAFTLHRLLGFSPRSGRFRHHANNPLGHELVVVDESSMVDLALMDRLLRSLRPEARLVLLGDADQLPSVEAGAVFRDLCRSEALARRGSIVRLTRSYRMDAEDPAGRAILSVAARIREGETLGSEVDIQRRSALEEVRREGVELLAAGAKTRLAWWRRWASLVEVREEVAGRVLGPPGDDGWPAEDVEILERLAGVVESARILTVHRGKAGGTGAAAVNRWFHEHHARRLGLPTRGGEPLPGEPVLVTRNDPRRGLFNGDQGIVLRVSDRDGRADVHAVFRRDGKTFRSYPMESLRGGLELAWATTVHKAQGSEMDHVTIVLPEETSRILTRELLYTAVTRARRSVVLLGSPSILDHAIRRTVERYTGLPERLETTSEEPPAGPERPGTGRQLELW